MNRDPLVSVSIVTYNHKSYIRRCLDGVLMQQTTFPFEIILGEDESSDGTREICKNYASKHPDKIRLFLRSRKDVIYINGNPTGRYNMLQNLKSASGKYIALLEGDDYWIDPLKLQKQVGLLENNPDLIACHHWQRIAKLKNGRFTEENAPKKGVGYFNSQVASVEHIFLNKLRLKTRTLMFRNVITDAFFPDWFKKVAYGDVPLTFILGELGDFGFINEEMAVYRQTGRGLSTAGLKDWGYNKFNIQHYKNWIDIWDKADTFYNYKYHKQASKTVNFFYREMFKTMSVKPIRFFEILTYNSAREISRLKTYKYIPGLFNLYIQLILKRVKQKFS